MMRHVYIRGILGLIWSVAAILGIVRGSMEMAALYALSLIHISEPTRR